VLRQLSATLFALDQSEHWVALTSRQRPSVGPPRSAAAGD
jgi:hypothetical protein